MQTVSFPSVKACVKRINEVSYTSARMAHVSLNLLEVLRQNVKMRGCADHLIVFSVTT